MRLCLRIPRLHSLHMDRRTHSHPTDDDARAFVHEQLRSKGPNAGKTDFLGRTVIRDSTGEMSQVRVVSVFFMHLLRSACMRLERELRDIGSGRHQRADIWLC